MRRDGGRKEDEKEKNIHEEKDGGKRGGGVE